MNFPQSRLSIIYTVLTFFSVYNRKHLTSLINLCLPPSCFHFLFPLLSLYSFLYLYLHPWYYLFYLSFLLLFIPIVPHLYLFLGICLSYPLSLPLNLFPWPWRNPSSPSLFTPPFYLTLLVFQHFSPSPPISLFYPSISLPVLICSLISVSCLSIISSSSPLDKSSHHTHSHTLTRARQICRTTHTEDMSTCSITHTKWHTKEYSYYTHSAFALAHSHHRHMHTLQSWGCEPQVTIMKTHPGV